MAATSSHVDGLHRCLPTGAHVASCNLRCRLYIDLGVRRSAGRLRLPVTRVRVFTNAARLSAPKGLFYVTYRELISDGHGVCAVRLSFRPTPLVESSLGAGFIKQIW